LALEELLERRGNGYPRASALREPAADIEDGIVDETLWRGGHAT
jgi:hypothetical protein